MASVWTHGTWVVKSGQERAFIDAWTRLARSAQDRYQSGRPVMLRDRERPNTFETFGSWLSIEAVEEFRASDLFRDAVVETQPLLESFEPVTLDEIEWT